MDYKYEIGSKVILDGSQVVEIVDREMHEDFNIYKVRYESQPDYSSLHVKESRLETALPGRLMRCECGADMILGKYNSFHSDWCPKYVSFNSIRKAT